MISSSQRAPLTSNEMYKSERSTGSQLYMPLPDFPAFEKVQ
jgi:hypothetical protein